MEDRENWPKWSPLAITYDPLQTGSIDGTDTTPHDRGLVRAMEAKYVPPNKNIATPDAEKTLFVGRLDHKTSEEKLKQEFSRYGTLTQCRVVKDVVTGFSRGYAFVQFKHLQDAVKARRDAHHAVLDGREILVEWENGRTMPGWIPRRLGGGFGGKKESGQLRFGGRDRPFRKPIIIKTLRRDKASNLNEEDVESFQQRDRQPTEEDKESEKNSSLTKNQWHNTKELQGGNPSGNFPRKTFSKPWDRINRGHTSGRGRSSRDRRDWNEEDRRYSSKPSRDSYEWDSYKRGEKNKRYYNKRDCNERDNIQDRDDRRRCNKSSRDRHEGDYSEKQDRRYSNKSSRDYNEWEDSYEKEQRRNPNKSDRGNYEERYDSHHRRSDKLEENKGEERSRRSEDRQDMDDSSQGRVNEEKHPKRSSKDRDDMGDWEDSPERLEGDKKRSRRSRDRDQPDELEESCERRSEKKKSKRSRRSEDRQNRDKWDDSSQGRVKEEEHHRSSKDGDWEDSPEILEKDRKRSRRSRERSESDDSGHERKSKKRKKHSKRSLRDRDDSDDSYERKKSKKKKKKK